MIAYAEADIEVNSTPKIVIHNSNSVILNEFEITGDDITSVLKKSFAYCFAYLFLPEYSPAAKSRTNTPFRTGAPLRLRAAK